MLRVVLSLVSLALLAAAGVVWLPQLRKQSWQETRVTSKNSAAAVVPVANENDIKEEMKSETSDFDPRRDLRTLHTLPTSSTALEAAYRKHRNDICEQLPAGNPMEFSHYTLALTPRDEYRSKELLFPSTRRQFFTVGLTMLSADEKTLPMLSRSTIRGYLEDHYLSLQARIAKDPVDSKWILNYRPIAAVGRYSGLPISQEWVQAIATTVNDICGLGILKSDDSDQNTQTAVLLFRSTWLDEEINRSVYRHELGFLHARKVGDAKPDEDPFTLDLVITSNERTQWHYFPHGSVSKPKNRNACGLVGTIQFTEFMSDGLQPKTAVTRRIDTKSRKSVSMEEIEKYLKAKELNGGWNENVGAVIEGIIRGEI